MLPQTFQQIKQVWGQAILCHPGISYSSHEMHKNTMEGSLELRKFKKKYRVGHISLGQRRP